MAKTCCCPSESDWLVLYDKNKRKVLRLFKGKAAKPHQDSGIAASQVSVKLSEFIEEFRKSPDSLDIIFNVRAPTKKAVQNMLSYEYALTGWDSVKVEQM